MRPRLIVTSGKLAGAEFDLLGTTMTVGRDPSGCVVFPPNDIFVSKHHATIIKDNKSFVLHDEQSLNGTYVNNDRIDVRTLQSGDVIQFGLGGPSVQFIHTKRRKQRRVVPLWFGAG